MSVHGLSSCQVYTHSPTGLLIITTKSKTKQMLLIAALLSFYNYKTKTLKSVILFEDLLPRTMAELWR
jgi:hypothetical protein